MAIITALKDTPIPTLLIVGGFIFLFLGLATLKKPIVIDIDSKNRKISLIFGVIFIFIGLFLLIRPTSNQSQLENMLTETPARIAGNITGKEQPTDAPISTDESNIPPHATIDDEIANPTNIVITEVLGNPSGADPRNEFIELYNNGDKPIDVDGWWITDGDSADEIVSWEDRYKTQILRGLVQTDTTQIPPHSFAVILAPGYPNVQGEQVMPYIFPEDTIILTIKEGQLLGDEENGIEVSNRDVIILYQGSKQVIDTVISTYGTPILSSSPLLVKDDGMDEIPIYLGSAYYWSVERIVAVNEDNENNWRKVDEGSPGSGPYP